MNDTPPPHSGRNPSALAGARILVVEDDELLRLALASFLRTAGASVLVAGDTEKAVEAIGEGGVDLVLSDIQLPGHSGLWLAEWVHAVRPALPVVLMSGTHPAAGALPPSVRRFFRKPVDPEALIEALASLRGA